MNGATLFAATLRLSEPVAAASVVHDLRTSLFLRLSGDVDGWAECPVAMATGLDATAVEVREALLRPHDDPARLDSAGLAARGLLATARLDAQLRRDAASLAASLGVRDDGVAFAGVIGLLEAHAAVARAEHLVALGVTRLRVKVTPEQGVAAVRAILEALETPVVADANGSFDPERDESALHELAELPLAWLEQPFAPGRGAALDALARRGVRLGADESVRSPATLDELLRQGTVAVVCIKPARVGVPAALEMLQAARRSGVDAYVGGYFEAGLGRAALGALSAAAGTIDGDVASPSTYLVEDPCHLAGPVLGRQPLHAGVGIGPLPDRTELVAVHEFDARELLGGGS